jgi:uncharacterized OsmC-like protein
MEIAKIIYEGELRTIATHLRSGKTVVTDAPPDNNGKGDAFSPTDLVSTALGSCMITIMGITANAHGITLGKIEAVIGKHMAANPRRIAQVDVYLKVEDKGLTDQQKRLLEHAADACPVAKSLSAEIIQNVKIEYY